MQISNLLLYCVNPLLFSLRFYRNVVLEYDHLELPCETSALSRTFHELVLFTPREHWTPDAHKQHVKSMSTAVQSLWCLFIWDACLFWSSWIQREDLESWTNVSLREQKEMDRSLWITAHLLPQSIQWTIMDTQWGPKGRIYFNFAFKTNAFL